MNKFYKLKDNQSIFCVPLQSNITINRDEVYLKYICKFGETTMECILADKNMYGVLEYPNVEFIVAMNQVEDRVLYEKDMIKTLPFIMPVLERTIKIEEEIIINGNSLYQRIMECSPHINNIIIDFSNVKSITNQAIKECFLKLLDELGEEYNKIIFKNMSEDVEMLYRMGME